jgi:nucleoside-diphosphate kinase
MEEACLVIIKPDGLLKSLTGNIINELSEAKLKIIGAKIVSVPKELAEKHYAELKVKKPHVYENTIKYIMGEFHTNRVLALVYFGENAIEKIRTITAKKQKNLYMARFFD